MLGVPICHGVVRWELLLHRGNGFKLVIGCTAWPVIGTGRAYDIPMALRNSWIWCPYECAVLLRGSYWPDGPPATLLTVLADGASE